MSATTWGLVVVCLVGVGVGVVSPSQEIMMKLSSGFSKALDECKEELKVGDHIMQDFTNYWREEYELLNREFGCVVSCMAGRHSLLGPGGEIHHDSAHQFARKHGADEETAKQVATMLTDCEKDSIEVTDTCLRALEVSKCFRTKIHQLKWAPTIEMILEEVLAEV